MPHGSRCLGLGLALVAAALLTAGCQPLGAVRNPRPLTDFPTDLTEQVAVPVGRVVVEVWDRSGAQDIVDPYPLRTVAEAWAARRFKATGGPLTLVVRFTRLRSWVARVPWQGVPLIGAFRSDTSEGERLHTAADVTVLTSDAVILSTATATRFVDLPEYTLSSDRRAQVATMMDFLMADLDRQVMPGVVAR